MSQSWFVTGTDTEIGKTWCTLALIQHFKNQGLRVAGMKPIASDCQHTKAGLRNSDAEQILKLSGLEVPYERVNPYAFEPPIAPHIAAKQVGQVIDINMIIERYHSLAKQADVVIIEGFGGWRLPVNETQGVKDLVFALQVPVILVVGLRLGCINHALLTAEAIARDGCTLAGWIANPVDRHFDAQDSIDTLKAHLDAPLLANLPFLATKDISQLAKTMQNTQELKFHSI
jgi:dethiobiotin synthetase